MFVQSRRVRRRRRLYRVSIAVSNSKFGGSEVARGRRDCVRRLKENRRAYEVEEVKSSGGVETMIEDGSPAL